MGSDIGITEVKRVLKSLILAENKNLRLWELNRAYKKMIGTPIPYKKFGFQSLELFLHHISDVVKVNGNGKSCTVTYVSNSKSAHLEELIKNQSNKKKRYRQSKTFNQDNWRRPPEQCVDDSFKDQTTLSASNKTEKMVFSLKKLTIYDASKTNKYFNCEDVRDERRASLESVPLSSKSDCKRNEVNDEKNYKVASYNVANNFIDWNEAVPAYAADNRVHSIDFPKDVVLFGQIISDYELPSDVQIGSVISIFISEIWDPSNFWFHINKEKHELDFLQHRMERFYRPLGDTIYNIPSKCLQPGLICAAKFEANGMWHRGEVLSSGNDSVKISFIDYGTISDVPSHRVKYLHSAFAVTPKQALRGCLAHIKPRCDQWSPGSKARFLALTSQLLLYANVKHIDKKNRIFHMVVCDTNTKKNIQINTALIQSGYAVLDK